MNTALRVGTMSSTVVEAFTSWPDAITFPVDALTMLTDAADTLS